MKTAICAIEKLENKYLHEWVSYHLSLGFDKIFLYDNNNIDGENPYDVISEYVDTGHVKIIDARGKHEYQGTAYNECFFTYCTEFDWFAFIDIDEFIISLRNENIKQYLSDPIFDDYDAICLTWNNFTDNDNANVKDDNFAQLGRFDNHYMTNICKQIIRGSAPVKTIGIHTSVKNNKNMHLCNATGEPTETYEDEKITNAMTDRMVINHYIWKTIEEWCAVRCTRQSAWEHLTYSQNVYTLQGFFSFNTFTLDKYKIARIYMADFPYKFLKRFLEGLPEEYEQLLLKNKKRIPINKTIRDNYGHIQL